MSTNGLADQWATKLRLPFGIFLLFASLSDNGNDNEKENESSDSSSVPLSSYHHKKLYPILVTTGYVIPLS